MRSKSLLLGAGQVLGALLALQLSAQAQGLPLCSWPLETTGSGITNVAYPDTNATYWTMPLDSTRWKSVVISGTYPQARFFSFTSYVAKGSVVDNGVLTDVDIAPDAGSTNPFVTTDSGPHKYTVTASLSEPSGSSNFLPLGNTQLVWIIYRIYVSDKGLDREAGVPLPTITLVGRDGRSHTPAACPSRNDPERIASLIRDFLSQGLDIGAGLTQILSGSNPGILAQQAPCQATPLVSFIPENTGGYFPNPANKYIAIPGLCFSPDQILVVRGKAPTFPDTYNGGTIFAPPGFNMRYWSVCNNNQRSPYPVVGCKADYQTARDKSGFYTYVVSAAESRNMETPSWVPPDATWLPWGSKTSANILLIRNMLPQSTFGNSVQAAIQQGCVVDNEKNTPIPRDQIVAGGDCAHRVMKEYYPRAVYCTKQVFINEGWKGCFAASSLGQ
jgi:hypothetical protein